MNHSTPTGWAGAQAERAFAKAVRQRRRASLLRRLLRRCVECAKLAVLDADSTRRSRADHGVREIPLAAIAGSVEPHRAAEFDREFRPAPRVRPRWISVWMAEERGAVLPPISVASIGEVYAVQDGHHRVSVARARGAVSISANVA